MGSSLHRNMLTLYGACFLVHFVGVVVGVPYEAFSRVFCEVNGKFYREGEYFASSNNPDLLCQCQRGYTGIDDVLPYCRSVKHDNSSDDNNSESMDDCVLITTNNESPKYTHYTELYRCPSDKAIIPISMSDNLRLARDERSACTFGKKCWALEICFITQ